MLMKGKKVENDIKGKDKCEIVERVRAFDFVSLRNEDRLCES